MQKKSLQEKIWESDFGKKYTKRNTFNSYQMWNRSYIKKFGVSKDYINKNFLQKLSKKIKILEIGCNIGNQLHGLQRIGFKNLSGIDIQQNCLKKIKKNFNNIRVVRASAYNLPFKNNSFDFVFTSNVLIHFPPNKINKVFDEIYRVSSKWIWGFEYFSNKFEEIIYRKNKDLLWKTDYTELFLKRFKNLHLEKEKFYRNISNNKEIDAMFLLKKITRN